MQTRDIDIRNALHTKTLIKHKNDPDTLVVDELGLCQGIVRIDIAVINGSINGYEIKSEKDTLERLPMQIEYYSKVLDTITIVTGECHLDSLYNSLPEWCGIKLAFKTKNDLVSFRSIRKPKKNPQIEPYCLAQLLWRDEALAILTELGIEKGFLSKPRNIIWRKLSDSIPLYSLQDYVRRQLKARSNWRSDLQQN